MESDTYHDAYLYEVRSCEWRDGDELTVAGTKVCRIGRCKLLEEIVPLTLPSETGLVEIY